MPMQKSSERPWVPAVAVAIACLGLAHLVQAFAGHDWFVSHAFAIAVPVSLAAGGFLAWRGRARGWGDRAADWAMTASTLVLLMLVPQWVEGELGSGHGLTLQAVRDCGIPTVIAAYAALYVIAVVGWTRLIRDVLRGGW